MARNKGSVVKLVSSKKALEMMGYKSQTSLDQFHDDEGFTKYEVSGINGRGGVGLAWSKKEINKWLRTEGRDTSEWLID
jgi:hypothetical protein